MTTEITFEAHHTQQLVLEDPHRFITMVCGRRWGKDHLASIKILSHSLTHTSSRGGKMYAEPCLTRAKKVSGCFVPLLKVVDL